MLRDLRPLRTALTVMCLASSGCGPGDPEPSALAAAQAPHGQFRGYETMSSVLRQRLLQPEHPNTDRFELGVLLGTRDPLGLPALLGGFSGSGPAMAYRGGAPNAMNTAVWYLALQRAALQMASYCQDPSRTFGDQYEIEPDLHRLVMRLCDWPMTSAQDLAAYFDRLMGAFAPPEERDLWLAFLEAHRTDPDVSGERLVQLATEMILLHPDFLLSH